MAGEGELPTPDSDKLKKLIPGHEARQVYRLLYERRTNPPTMTEIRQLIEQQFDVPHAQTDRRLRDLRSIFDVASERVSGARNEFRYRLRGWRTDAESRSRRGSISPRVEAQVYSLYGNRCAMCGKTPKDDAIRLVIDHIIPLEWGGNNEVSNLQSLCEYHNHAKQAHFSSFDRYGPYIRQAIGLREPHLRIGELLKAMKGEEVPVELISLVAREENRGDPTRRLRELRDLRWIITATRRKQGRRTSSYYTLEHSEPWPLGGPGKVIRQLEYERRRRKRSDQSS